MARLARASFSQARRSIWWTNGQARGKWPGQMLAFGMLYQELEAPSELRDTIKCFWYTRMDFGAQPSTFEIMPDGYPALVFQFGRGCSIVQGGDSPPLRSPLPSPFRMGLLNQPVLLST